MVGVGQDCLVNASLFALQVRISVGSQCVNPEHMLQGCWKDSTKRCEQLGESKRLETAIHKFEMWEETI